MKTTYTLSTFLTLILLVMTVMASDSSPLKLKNDGDLKDTRLNTKESISASRLDRNISAPAEDNFEYLRFDVTKYAATDLDYLDNMDEIFFVNDNEFEYLKFNTSKYVNQDSVNLELIDSKIIETDEDYSYLKFDVSKYAGKNMNLTGE
jgi:hypothetical protein